MRRGAVKNLVATAVQTFGGLHCAFNNAGVLPPMALLADVEESAFDHTFAVDVKGIFLAMKYEIQQMLETGGGAIVNNGSIAGLVAEPGISAYVAAKHGVIGLSKAAAVEYANKGIRINALAPGLDNTAMTKAWFDDPSMSAHFLNNTPIGRVSAGRNRGDGTISLFRPRLVYRRSDVRDRRRVHDSLSSRSVRPKSNNRRGSIFRTLTRTVSSNR